MTLNRGVLERLAHGTVLCLLHVHGLCCTRLSWLAVEMGVVCINVLQA
jgi:hypothetical protein